MRRRAIWVAHHYPQPAREELPRRQSCVSCCCDANLVQAIRYLLGGVVIVMRTNVTERTSQLSHIADWTAVGIVLVAILGITLALAAMG